MMMAMMAMRTPQEPILEPPSVIAALLRQSTLPQREMVENRAGRCFA
jgi:hypothetical protein